MSHSHTSNIIQAFTSHTEDKKIFFLAWLRDTVSSDMTAWKSVLVIWSCMMGCDPCFCKSLQCFFHMHRMSFKIYYWFGFGSTLYFTHVVSFLFSLWWCWSINLCTSTQSYVLACPMLLHALCILYTSHYTACHFLCTPCNDFMPPTSTSTPKLISFAFSHPFLFFSSFLKHDNCNNNGTVVAGSSNNSIMYDNIEQYK